LSARKNVFISYASADADVARRIVNCLKDYYQDIWFDENEIVWGDNVIQKINSGLTESLMGFVILSDNFFNRAMPQLELNTMIYLMNSVHFRILPLFHGLNHNDLQSKYPSLISIRGESADDDCKNLASKFSKALDKTMQIVNVAVKISTNSSSASNVSNDDNLEEVNSSELNAIYQDLTNNTGENRRSAAVTTLRHYSETRRIWKHRYVCLNI
jgi:hypothetical protein